MRKTATASLSLLKLATPDETLHENAKTNILPYLDQTQQRFGFVSWCIKAYTICAQEREQVYL